MPSSENTCATACPTSAHSRVQIKFIGHDEVLASRASMICPVYGDFSKIQAPIVAMRPTGPAAHGRRHSAAIGTGLRAGVPWPGHRQVSRCS